MTAPPTRLASAARLAAGDDRGWLEMRGKDARDFLQRILSSDLRKLQPGGGQWSALLDGKGHWLAELMLFAWTDADGEVLGFDTPRGCMDLLEASLEKFHFGEALVWRRGAPARLLVLGEQAEALLIGAGLPVPAAPPEAEAAVRGLAVASAGAEGLALVLRRPDRGQPCLEVLGDPAAVTALAASLRTAGATDTSEAELEHWRIAAGIPRLGADFDERDTLPESNEWRRASLSKGCYAGQEVVAKINTYGEAPWQLVRLLFEGADDMRGAALLAEDGASVGSVTSWTLDPATGAGIGLAKVRRKAAHDGARLVSERDGARDHATLQPQAREFG